LNGAEQKGWTEREKETPQTPRNRPAVEATADTSLSLLPGRIHQLDQARSSGGRSKERRTNAGQVAAGEEPGEARRRRTYALALASFPSAGSANRYK